MEEIPFNVFQQVMETNFFGALRCIKAVVSGMRERRRGTIVNVTSLAGRIARASLAPYAASKWALEALSECLAQEMRAFDVRVVIAEPGVIATPILTKRVSDSSGWSLSPCPADRGPLRRQARQSLDDLIRDIVDGDSWQLRYPAGPDAAPALKGRASKTDEQVVTEAAESDDEFVARVKREFGLDLTL